eukprot:6456011-Prymnesium_polylepis.1
MYFEWFGGDGPVVGVCVLRVDGTWHADGARVRDAQQTRRAHARSSTHTSGVRSQHPLIC